MQNFAAKPRHDLLSTSASLRRLAFLRGKNLQCPEKQGLHSRKSPENPVSLMMHRRKAGVGGVCGRTLWRGNPCANASTSEGRIKKTGCETLPG